MFPATVLAEKILDRQSSLIAPKIDQLEGELTKEGLGLCRRRTTILVKWRQKILDDCFAAAPSH